MNVFKTLKNRYLKWGIVTAAIFSICYLLMMGAGFLLASASVIEFLLSTMPQEKLQGVNVLVLGVDDTKYSTRSDTIMVLHIDSGLNRVGILSIPRDTRVNVPGHGLTKLNHAYAYGGVDLVRTVASDFLNLQLDYFIRINLNGVEKIIDDLGGITINVEKDLYYVDQAGDLYINLKKGTQKLSGREALQYLRFRQDSQGDLGRISRQQTFMKTLLHSVIDQYNVSTYPALIARLSNNMDTNLSTKQMIGLAMQFSEVYEGGDIQVGTVPGRIAMIEGVSYWKPRISEMDRFIEHVLVGKNRINRRVVSKVKTVDDSSSEESRRRVTLKEVSRISEHSDLDIRSFARVEDPLSVEVLNGYGAVGEASYASQLLRQMGIKVPNIGNAGSFDYEVTLLVDWKGNLDAALSFAKALNIDPTKIIVYDRQDKAIDMTVVMGKDWPSVKKRLEDIAFEVQYE